MPALTRRALGLGVLLVLAAAPAHAAFPGSNGRIAYGVLDTTSGISYDIYSMEPDGSDARNLTATQSNLFTPSFNAAADLLAVGAGGGNGISTILPDGTGRTTITPSGGSNQTDSIPSFTPDGTRLVFGRLNMISLAPPVTTRDIYIVNLDGTGLTNLTADTLDSVSTPKVSPDGTRIAYTSTPVGGTEAVWTMRLDGTDKQLLQEDGFSPDWAPDGSRVTFASLRDNQGSNAEIYSVAADGTDVRNLTNDPDGDDREPVYSPDGTKIAYARTAVVASATQSDIYVVPAAGGTGTPLTTTGPQINERSPSWGVAAGTGATPTPTPTPTPTATPVGTPTATPSVVPTATPTPVPPADSTVDGFRLVGKKAVKQKGKAVKVKVGAKAGETVRVKTKAKIRVKKKRYATKAATKTVPAGKAKRFTLKPRGEKAAKQVRKAIKRYRKAKGKRKRKLVVKAVVTAVATDAAGNTAKARRTLLLK